MYSILRRFSPGNQFAATSRLCQMSSSPSFNRPSPPPLPPQQQREFEDLFRRTQSPLASTSPSTSSPLPQAEITLHPDAPKPLKPEFEGDINPTTGEQGGPKHEPVHRYSEDSGGDWSFKGRVSDF